MEELEKKIKNLEEQIETFRGRLQAASQEIKNKDTTIACLAEKIQEQELEKQLGI